MHTNAFRNCTQLWSFCGSTSDRKTFPDDNTMTSTGRNLERSGIFSDLVVECGKTLEPPQHAAMNCHVPFRLGSSRALLCITAIFQLFLLVTCPFESHFRLLELPLICSAWSSLAGHGWQACLQRSFRDSRCDATLQVPDPAFLKKGYEFVQKSLLCRTRWCSHAAVALYKIWIKKSNTVFFPELAMYIWKALALSVLECHIPTFSQSDLYIHLKAEWMLMSISGRGACQWLREAHNLYVCNAAEPRTSTQGSEQLARNVSKSSSSPLEFKSHRIAQNCYV